MWPLKKEIEEKYFDGASCLMPSPGLRWKLREAVQGLMSDGGGSALGRTDGPPDWTGSSGRYAARV